MSKSILSPAKLLYDSLKKFYNVKANYNKILFLRDKKESKVSLRIYDKYVTQYAKKKTILIPGETDTYVYDAYKSQLTAWGKKMFDPNSRDHTNKNKQMDDDKYITKFNLSTENGSIPDTNIGQLNFFRWIIQNKIYDLIIKDLDAVKDFVNKN